jgi:hypothetical protein
MPDDIRGGLFDPVAFNPASAGLFFKVPWDSSIAVALSAEALFGSTQPPSWSQGDIKHFRRLAPLDRRLS